MIGAAIGVGFGAILSLLGRVAREMLAPIALLLALLVQPNADRRMEPSSWPARRHG